MRHAGCHSDAGMAPPVTQILTFSDESIARAAELIRAGEPVAMPTETVYGLAADATNAEAVAPIPDQGLGAAINDRLRRAAAPR